jgi:CheY-like chemotaxis protein
MSTDRRLNVLLLGDDSTAEMRPVRDTLCERTANTEQRHFRGVASAIASLQGDEDWHPDLIVVCQTWPDEFSSPDLHALLSTFPLARLMCCHGPWCESDGRSRSIWPSGCRVPVAHARRRLASEAVGLQTGRTDRLPPLTASRDELFEFEYADAWRVPRRLDGCGFAVHSPDAAYRRVLVDTLRAAGGLSVSESNALCRVVLYDADPWTPVIRTQIALCHAGGNQSIQIVALTGIAHAGMVDELKVAGADRVVAKPVPLGELVDTVAELSSELRTAEV